MKFFYNTIVWNKTYLDLFNDFAIPSLLTNKQLNNNSSEYYIAITSKDYEYLKAKKNYKLLEKFIKIKIHFIQSRIAIEKYKYEVVRNIQKLFLLEAFEKKFDIFFLIYPDSVYSRNFIDRSRNILKEKDVLMCPSINVNSSNLNIKEFILNKFSNKYISKIAVENLSYFHQSFLFDNLNKLDIPLIIRKQKNENLIVNGFYHHPAAFKLKISSNLLKDFKNSIDVEHIYNSYQYIDSYYVPKNSNDLIIISIEDQLSERNQNARTEINSKLHTLSNSEKIDLIINYAETYTIKTNRDIFTQDYEIIKNIPEKNISEGTSLIDLIYSELFLPDSHIKLHKKNRYVARKKNIYFNSYGQMVSNFYFKKDKYGSIHILTSRYYSFEILQKLKFKYNSFIIPLQTLNINYRYLFLYIILKFVHSIRDHFPSFYYYLRNKFPSKKIKNEIKQKNIKHLSFFAIIYLLLFKK